MIDNRKFTLGFSLLFVFFVIGLMSSAGCNPTEKRVDLVQTEETEEADEEVVEEVEETEEDVIDVPVVTDGWEADWVNPPYYHESTASYIPLMYGMIEQRAKKDRIDKSFFPSIPGLYFKSCMESCQRDFCKSKRAVLAISCPKKEPLLRWVSDRACDFANACIEDSLKRIRPNYSLHSAQEICDYYIGVARSSFKTVVKDCSHEADLPCEQRGRLIADVWQKGNLHTFMVAGWYDWESCGDNTAVSYITVDAATGKGFMYADLIAPSDEAKMEKLLLMCLSNGSEKWNADADRVAYHSKSSLVSQMDGCALLKEGLLIYYYPYTIGFGADGQFNAVIPYEVLKKNGIKLKVSM